MQARHGLCGLAMVLALGCASSARAQAIGQSHGHDTLELQFERSTSAPPSDVLALGGFALFAFAYSDSVFVALLSDRPEDKRLYIPVAGPWLDLGQRDCAARPCSAEWLSASLLVVDGVAQGAGAALMIASLFVPDRPMDVRIGGARVRLSPARLEAGGYGLQATGRF